MIHRAGQGERFLNHRLAFRGRGDVRECFDIVHHASNLNWNARRRNQPPGRRINQIVLIARWIIIPQQMHFYRGALASGLHRVDGVLILRLDADNALIRTDGFHRKQHALHDFF